MKEAPVTASAGTHDGIDALRGLAALMVALFHMNQVGFGLTSPAWTQAGLLGVNVFFTLSGFLIARCVMAPASFSGRAYLVSRARRILPNYFIALLLVISVVDVRSLLHVPVARAAGDLVTHALLIHGWFPEYRTSILGPFWTLSHEWWFYLLMLAAAPVLRTRRWWTVPLGMAGAALVVRLGFVHRWWPLPGGLEHPVALWDQFAAGILAAGCTLNSASFRPRPWLHAVLLALGAAIVAWSVWQLCHQALQVDASRFKGGNFSQKTMEKFYARRSHVTWFSTVLAVGVAALVAGLWLTPHRRWKLPVLPWTGRVSYSTYLYHMPVVLCFGRSFKNLPSGSFWSQPAAGFFLVLTVVYAFSAFAWHFFEKPWLRPRPLNPQTPRPGCPSPDRTDAL